MTANTAPIFTKTPINTWDTIAAANTALDGTGTVAIPFTADGTNGGYVQSIFVKSNTTTATSAATVFRIFVNNGSTNATPANNSLFREYTLTTVTATATAATLNFEFPLNIQLAAGYRILCTAGTLAGSTGYNVTCLGGNY